MLSRKNGQTEVRVLSGKANAPPSSASSMPAPAQPSTAILSSMWPASGNIPTYLRCLRLLDLDLQDDWPSGTDALFSAKTSQQSLQQRVKFVEWSLYRLFEIWDYAYARDKLSPFFPPLAPLQSLNLRAALFRGLTDLKKNGILARDVTLRKTMLDECKGERFEEVIRTFAMLVLRKRAQMKFGREPGFAELFAGRKGLLEEQHARMSSLIIAHLHKLHRLVGQRMQIENGMREEQSRLVEHQLALEQWQENVRTASKTLPGLKPGEPELYRDALEATWMGDENWIDFLLHGGPYVCSSNHRGLMQATTEQSSESPRKEGVKPVAELLMENLSDRIAHQRRRLKKWTEFRLALTQSPHRSSDNTSSKPVTQLIHFNDHQKIRISSRAGAEKGQQDTQFLRPEDMELVSDLQSELANLRVRSGQTPNLNGSNKSEHQNFAEIPGRGHPLPDPIDTMPSEPDSPSDVLGQEIHAQSLRPSTPPVKRPNDSWPSPPSSSPDIVESSDPPRASVGNLGADPSSLSLATKGVPHPLNRLEKSIILLPPFSKAKHDGADASFEKNGDNVQHEVKKQQGNPPAGTSMPISPVSKFDRAHLGLTFSSTASHGQPPDTRTPSPKRSQILPSPRNRQLISSASPSRVRKQTVPSTPSKPDSQLSFKPKTPVTPVELDLDVGDYASVFKSRPRVALSPPPSPSPPRLQDRQTREEIGNGSGDEDIGGLSNLRSSPIRDWG